MARHETDREDLLAEATALDPRVEWFPSEAGELVTAGQRRDGAASIYFGGDPVYQFDAAGRLRRAFVDGLLYRTQGTTLARLTRIRTDRETILKRGDLTAREVEQFLTEMQQRLERFLQDVQRGHVALTRRVASDAAVEGLLAALDNAVRVRRLAPGLATRPE